MDKFHELQNHKLGFWAAMV